MKAFHGKQEVKDFYIARIKAHRAADEIVKGQYWEKDDDGVFRGCAIGCSLHTADHNAIVKEWDFPLSLGYLEDCIFENLPQELALDWPLRFVSAPKPGSDLSHIVDHFLIWVLTDGVHGVIRFAQKDNERAAIQAVSDLYVRKAANDNPSPEEWDAAEDAAGAAARAAEDAAGAAAEDAARAARAAGDAAGAAAGAAAWAVRDTAYISFADKLIELMKAA